MTTLLVLRHGKSDWDDDSLPDHERPLARRGQRDAPRMGRLLRDEKMLPDLILTSSATRARQTAEAVAEAAGYRGDVMAADSLYPGDPGAWLEALSHLLEGFHRVMVVGHNPELQDLVEQLTGSSVVLPTAALALIELPIPRWDELDQAT